jgi:hypothetical protein
MIEILKLIAIPNEKPLTGINQVFSRMMIKNKVRIPFILFSHCFSNFPNKIIGRSDIKIKNNGITSVKSND